MVCVMAPMAMKMVVTPKMIRKELKMRPAWDSGMNFAIPHRGHGDQGHVEGVEGRVMLDEHEAHRADQQSGGDRQMR